MKILVAQLGARRHYAVPLAFHLHGHLSQFCTDIFITNRILNILKAGVRVTKSKRFERLSGRTQAAIPEEKVRTFPIFGLEYKWRLRCANSPEARTSAWLWGGRRFCQLAAKEMDRNCNAVYAYTSAAKELFQHARENGTHAYLDHATAPRKAEMALVQEEAARFPGWGAAQQTDRLTEVYHERQREELALADLVICGSTFVQNLVEAEGVDPIKIRTVPLGIDHRFFAIDRTENKRGKKLKVLFVGGDGLRKGIGYLAKAIELMRSEMVEARVAGDLGISRKGQNELRRNLNILGPVPRTEMKRLFRWADVLVLPSISDTFGLVLLEAMATGIPVIATPHTCGPDVIREGQDGFIVPIRDAEAIAGLLEHLASNPMLIHTMGQQARIRAKDYTIMRYGERLIEATMTDKTSKYSV